MDNDVDMLEEEAPVEIQDTALGSDFDALNDKGEALPGDAPAANTEADSESSNTESNTESESESANTESNTESESESANTESNTESESESANTESNTESESANTESNTGSESESGSNDNRPAAAAPSVPINLSGIELPPAWDPTKVSPSELVADILKDLGDVEVVDPDVEGGKVKLADAIKDTPQFQQITAAMAGGLINRFVAPLGKAMQAIMPALQQQSAVQQRESVISALVSDEKMANAREILDSEDVFWKWHDEQPPEVQGLVASANPKSIAKAIRLFQQETGKFTKAEAGAAAPDPAKVAADKSRHKGSDLHRGAETSRASGAPVSSGPSKALEDEFSNLGDDD